MGNIRKKPRNNLSTHFQKLQPGYVVANKTFGFISLCLCDAKKAEHYWHLDKWYMKIFAVYAGLTDKHGCKPPPGPGRQKDPWSALDYLTVHDKQIFDIVCRK